MPALYLACHSKEELLPLFLDFSLLIVIYEGWNNGGEFILLLVELLKLNIEILVYDCYLSAGSIIVGSLEQIFRKEGLRGMYRGLAPTVLALLPNWAVSRFSRLCSVWMCYFSWWIKQQIKSWQIHYLSCPKFVTALLNYSHQFGNEIYYSN